MGMRLSYVRIKINEIQGTDFFLLDACTRLDQKGWLNPGLPISATAHTKAKRTNLNCASMPLGTVSVNLQTQDTNFYTESSN